jgi:hypothetical protein
MGIVGLGGVASICLGLVLSKLVWQSTWWTLMPLAGFVGGALIGWLGRYANGRVNAEVRKRLLEIRQRIRDVLVGLEHYKSESGTYPPSLDALYQPIYLQYLFSITLLMEPSFMSDES